MIDLDEAGRKKMWRKLYPALREFTEIVDAY